MLYIPGGWEWEFWTINSMTWVWPVPRMLARLICNWHPESLPHPQVKNHKSRKTELCPKSSVTLEFCSLMSILSNFYSKGKQFQFFRVSTSSSSSSSRSSSSSSSTNAYFTSMNYMYIYILIHTYTYVFINLYTNNVGVCFLHFSWCYPQNKHRFRSGLPYK